MVGRHSEFPRRSLPPAFPARQRRRPDVGRNDPKCTAPSCRFEAVGDQGVCVRHGGTRPVRPTADAPIDAPGMRFCGATTRNGGRCNQPARRGGTCCRIHSGSAPQVERRAAERVAEASLAEIARH